MQRVVALVSCVGLAVMLTACTVGSGEIVTESRSVEGFDGIDLRGSGEVRITVDGTESLTIEAEDNIIDHLTSDVSGGMLILGVDRPISATEDIIYTVTMISLNDIVISGSGAIDVDEFSTEDFAVEVSGSGNASVTDIGADTVVVRISGSGTVSVDGDAETLDLSIGGSGSFDGEALTVDTGDVAISGSGSATVNVREILDVQVSGSGSVEYLGDPSVSVDTSGSGSVSRR